MTVTAPVRPRTCRVCGCTDDRACMTGDGPCFWIGDRDDLCSACAPVSDHIVSMTIDWQSVPADNVATCRCGWAHREARVGGGSSIVRRMDVAIRAHWRSVVAAAVAA